jgi:drug/metabolite transporter (DMT)-like permease
MLLAIVAALVAAALYALASALQHRSATTDPARPGQSDRMLTEFMAATLRHPLWLAGTVADLIGLAAHVVALDNRPLSLVQPLMISGVAFALPLRHRLDRRRPERRGGALLAMALAAFLGIATPADAMSSTADRACSSTNWRSMPPPSGSGCPSSAPSTRLPASSSA